MSKHRKEQISHYERLLFYSGFYQILKEKCEKHEDNVADLVKILEKKEITLPELIELTCLFDIDVFTNNQTIIKSLISQKEYIGHGEYGSVSSIVMKNRKFALKTNIDKHRCLREAYVSTLVNTVIEKNIPQFVYFFGLMNKNKVLVYEFIEGKTVENFVIPEGRGEEKILGIILEIICALSVAQTQIQFIHNDLNSGNLIIREGDSKTYEFKVHDKKITITCPYLTKIIDYGFARVYKDFESVNNTVHPEILDSPRYDTCRLLYGFLGKGYDDFVGSLLYSIMYGVWSKTRSEIIHPDNEYEHYLTLAEKRPEERNKSYYDVLLEIVSGSNIISEVPNEYEKYKKYLENVITIEKI
jgi:serine/threonine protein kinase